jgi:TM2 domain-containing membrane protein YozV
MTDNQTVPVGTARPASGTVSDAEVKLMRYDANKKSLAVAYLLWFFVGGFGAHRFYLGRIKSGIALPALFILPCILAFFVPLAIFLIAVAGIWLFADIFLIPGMVRDWNNRLINELK